MHGASIQRVLGATLAFSVAALMPANCLSQSNTIPKDVTRAVQEVIAKNGANVGLVLERLDGTLRFSLNGDETFHAASTMKIPVMMELFHQAREGKLRLDDSLPVKNEFHSIVDGSIFRLEPADDSDKDLYKAAGQTRTLTQLCQAMITVSSNLATNLLIEKLGVENIRAMVRDVHADGMNVVRGVEDQKAFDKGWNNTTTARGLAVLLVALAKGQAVDLESSRQMVAILEQQTFNEAIPAGLPPKIPVAHKTGEITKIHHDAAIVYAARPFVLVILVRGMDNFEQSSALMADITRLLYPATQQTE
jgi:beta-lactamase class A